MATCKEQCFHQKAHERSSNKWFKKQFNKFLRRQAKVNPVEAWKRKYFCGYKF